MKIVRTLVTAAVIVGVGAALAAPASAGVNWDKQITPAKKVVPVTSTQGIRW